MCKIAHGEITKRQKESFLEAKNVKVHFIEFLTTLTPAYSSALKGTLIRRV